MNAQVSVEARTLASGQVTYLIRATPPSDTIEDVREAIDLVQQAVMYALGIDEEDSQDEEQGDEESEE